MVNVPILPIYMFTIRTNLEATPKSVWQFVDSPHVVNAEMDSKIRLTSRASGSKTDKIKVEQKIRIRDMMTME